ncbi:twin-arginine translocase TatA/TatE family subunit [Gemmatimonadota bacterium]
MGVGFQDQEREEMPISGLGLTEMIMIFLVVLLLFGAKRLPEIGSALGKGIREFKSSVSEIEGELKAPLEDRKTVPPPPKQDSDQEGPRRLTATEEERPG